MLQWKRKEDKKISNWRPKERKTTTSEGGPRFTRQAKQKEVQFQEKEATSESSEGPSRASTSQDVSTQKKPIKKGPGYLLAWYIEQTIEAEEIAENFGNKKPKGSPMEIFLEVYI